VDEVFSMDNSTKEEALVHQTVNWILDRVLDVD
jgi:hypothetical protein